MIYVKHFTLDMQKFLFRRQLNNKFQICYILYYTEEHLFKTIFFKLMICKLLTNLIIEN